MLAAEKLASTKASLATARARMDAAGSASRQIAGDPGELARAERDAGDMLRFAERAVAIAQDAHATAQAAKASAWGETFRPVHDEGRALRLAAARRADAARGELAAADADFRRGGELILAARGEGCRGATHFDGAKLAGPVTSERAEHALWEQ